jgi:hypothetical protein
MSWSIFSSLDRLAYGFVNFLLLFILITRRFPPIFFRHSGDNARRYSSHLKIHHWTLQIFSGFHTHLSDSKNFTKHKPRSTLDAPRVEKVGHLRQTRLARSTLDAFPRDPYPNTPFGSPNPSNDIHFPSLSKVYCCLQETLRAAAWFGRQVCGR